ncbi:hypothetical protein K2173_013493 [Erythroxylum novogranatense]|uniref:E3 ubiquitin protein ligase n=1 Tax=Erythroxylum novogranatense TaxID=1862640 RepID=A0AAV8SA69_9ROSI|nr:hypothetical protein K2173_013493 [Erythroxylum novogranatense]
MGSEPERKRRQFSSISPTAMAKKNPFSQASEDKKLGAAVLQYQNQKIAQKVEAQKIEYRALENKFHQLKEKQQPFDSTVKAVNKSWEGLGTGLESRTTHTRDSTVDKAIKPLPVPRDGARSPVEDAFLSRLIETGATECSSPSYCINEMEKDGETTTLKVKNILSNVIADINGLWLLKSGLCATALKELAGDREWKQKASYELETEVKQLRLSLTDVHLKIKLLARQLQKCQDGDAKSKAELNNVKVELESEIAKLEEDKSELATLKAERDATKGAFFPVLNLGSKHAPSDKVRDKQKDLGDMESSLKKLLDQASSRLLEIKGLYDDRVKILRQLSDLQNSLKNMKCISSSETFLVVRNQVEKSKSEMLQYQALFEKLQVEKDTLVWRERELCIKNDLVDVFQRSSAVSNSRIADLRIELEKQIHDKKLIEVKLEDSSREPGRKDIIAQFKALVSSFPEEMNTMQCQLNNFKEAASNIHSLRADMQSLSNVLDRKAKDYESLSTRSAGQVAEIQKLQSVAQNLKESHQELKLMLEMYRRESIDSRDILDARDLEYKAWARVQSLKASLDEQSLELRVKTANEAEAISQQRLAAAEAEIVDLGQKLEASKRDMSRLTEILKSKSEESEAYLSEIETIGQAYDDMQAQNQQLLQQITERDDYNIKLVLESLKSRQLWDSILLEKKVMEREIQQSAVSHDFFDVKASRIEDQLKICADQVQKLAADKFQNSLTLENTHNRLLEVRRASNQARELLEDSQCRVGESRAALLDLQIEIERERFDKRRKEEGAEVVRRKISCLQAQTEGSSIVEKLQQELKEYREIVKCSICMDRPKEVVITKCYHLFCSHCVQKLFDSRHRKCPSCTTNFGPNDVKPVYI